MSNRPCNLCDLKETYRRFKKDERKLVLGPIVTKSDQWIQRGVNLYAVPPGKNLNSKAARKRYFLCWYGKIPDRCSC